MSLYRAPKDAERLEAWPLNTICADKDLDNRCVVYGIHFEAQFVGKTFKYVVNGEPVEMGRLRSSLRDDTIPTVFPDEPTYFAKKVLKKSKVKSLCRQLSHVKSLKGRHASIVLRSSLFVFY